MKLSINGDVKPYYIQMLAMLYFPGEKFPEICDISDLRAATVNLERKDNGVFAEAYVKDGENEEYGSSFIEYSKVPREKAAKFASGGAFIKACSKLTGHNPPWGMLTGVRPAKLADDLLETGYTPDEAHKFFTEVYGCTQNKAALAVTTAVSGNKIVSDKRREQCSLYIAIPFCPTRCAYCSFVSYTSPKLLSMIPDYLDALCYDIERTVTLIRELDLELTTVYIGGGTPTVLSAQQLEVLLDCICSHISGLDEFTLEAGRPDTITEEKLLCAKRHGVTRVSVNTQTLNETVLKNIGRFHSVNDFFRAYELADKMNFRDLNVDLIAGLPGDTPESFAYSVDNIVLLHPTNITVHTFSVKKSAELKNEGHDVFDRDGINASVAVDYSQNKLMGSGYFPYYMYRQKNTVGNLENVGYSLEGHEGLYNVFMMNEIHTVFACGASSVTKLVGRDENGSHMLERLFEPKYPYEYLRDRNSEEFIKAAAERENHIREFYKSYRVK